MTIGTELPAVEWAPQIVPDDVADTEIHAHVGAEGGGCAGISILAPVHNDLTIAEIDLQYFALLDIAGQSNWIPATVMPVAY